MSDRPFVDTKVWAQQYRDQAPPYECPLCKKVYKSVAGILYHIGQFRGVTKVPRCMLGEDLGRGSPVRGPSSPVSARKKTPKREALTWAESQRLVEAEFDNDYQRIEIDGDLQILESVSDVDNGGSDEDTNKKRDSKSQTPQKGSRTKTPRGKASSSRTKGKRRSKLKTPAKDNTPNQHIRLPEAQCTVLDNLDFPDAPSRDLVYYRFIDQSNEEIDDMIEYDIDEEDNQWLSLINEERKTEGLTSVPQEAFELLMDRLEKECVFESQVSGNGTESTNPYNIDENAVCCICNDGECHNTNAILFCDMCNLAVHQECYGVPYIPEGQWLCRRCLQSPSRSVDCVLCPNKGGAFKQTVDGRWAHVICALWIPEVQFSNTVFLEPIDGVKDVPSARWKLVCYICRKRCGASIQCAKANCYTAFHVTCAQQASLCMKIEIGKNGEIVKSAFCDSHTPPSARKKLLQRLEEGTSGPESEEDKEEEVKEPQGGKEETPEMSAKKKGKGESKIVKRARKILEEQRATQAPVVNLPYIPQHRLDRISSCVSLHKKSQFIPKLVSYWKLKRQSRNGVPFLRRLQANSKGQKTTMAANLSEEEKQALFEQLSFWKALRHDLERARMLVELVRKREKLKREQLRMSEEISRLSLTPMEVVMKRILFKLMSKDPADIFAEPVSIEEVPDYLDVIKHPMDFGTMKQKVEAHLYPSFREFEKDISFVWNNAMIYNQKDTIYYRAAHRIKEAGKRILEDAHEQLDNAGVSIVTGMHDPDVEEPPPLTPNAAALIQKTPLDMFTREGEFAEENILLSGRDRLSSTTLDEKMEYLEEQLSVLDSQCKGSARKSREKQLRKELGSLRRQIKHRDKANDPNSILSSPLRRKPAVSPPRDAEGLASQLLHGSLRLTDSRRAILSSSGIKLEERVSALQRQKEEEDVEEEEEEMMVEKNIFEGTEKDLSKLSVSSSITEESESRMQWKVIETHCNPTKRRRGRRRNRSYPMSFERTRRRRDTRESRTQNRLPSETNDTEVGRVPLNGVSTRTRSENRRVNLGSSSSLGDEGLGEYTNDNRQLCSPPFPENTSDHRSVEHVDKHPIPTASTINDLTVSSTLVLKRKRKHSTEESESDTQTTKRKRKSRDIGREINKGFMKGLNGITNGLPDQLPLQPLELVWAKCRGYPSFPALVIDPDMPSDGQKVSGEFIQAPSEEVLEHREKNPHNTVLVRFFDGRRSWQWLPPSKIDRLGKDKDFDVTQISISGPSKRSVQQAYERAMRHRRKVLKKLNTEEDSDNISSSS